jgi:RNA polymerase sigma-54 factor
VNTPALRLDQRQHQALTPRLQHAVRLLQLSSLDFAHELSQLLSSNPFLEEDAEGATAVPAQGSAEPEVMTPEPPQPGEFQELGQERDSWSVTGRSLRAVTDPEFDPMARAPAHVSLRDHLLAQLRVMPLSARDMTLVCTVAEALDDDGYLRVELAELAPLAGLDPPPDEDEMRVALRLVQSLEPSGVGARDVRECLLLQLGAGIDPAHRTLAQRIVCEHIDQLASHDVNGLARSLGCSPQCAQAVCDAIRRLDPRPGWRHAPPQVQYVTPDVIVRKQRGTWTVELNPDVVPRLRLNQVYAELFQQHRDDGHAQMAAHLQEARWTLRNVEQRFDTILQVARAITRRQHRFLEYGALAMRPLGLREIAEELGLHESTVSRVTNNKYMATPQGVFELKYFFSRALEMASGGKCSATAIRGLIREMIEAEDPCAPLSDVDLAAQLGRQGLMVARRTVTKYRQMLRLPAVEKRRRR